MGKKRNLLSIVVLILIVVLFAFIWGNSLESIPDSRARSSVVKDMVEPLLEVFVGEGNVTMNLVRKLAHLIEFGLLGVGLTVFVILRKQRGLQAIVNCLFVGLIVALADETIQLYSNRGSQVQDVLLDFGGVAAGVVLAWLAYWVLNKLLCRKQT